MSGAGDPLRTAAQRWPDAIAVVGSGPVLTYRALNAWVDALAGTLGEGGLDRDGVVALAMPNAPVAIALLLAVIRCGGVASPLNLRNPEAVLVEQARRVGATLVIADKPLQVVGAKVMRVAACDGPNSVRDVRPAGMSLKEDRLATLLFTSGSTAAPKIAAHRLEQHLASAAASNAFHGLGTTDRWLLALPLCHVGGLAILFRCLLAGAGVALPAAGEALPAAVARLGVTQLSLVPTQLRRLLVASDGRDPLASVRCILLGGAPAPDADVAAARARGWPVRKTYGLTEMTSQVTAVPPGATEVQALKAGRVLGAGEVRLAADGEILVRGPALFAGYWEGGRCERPVDAQGWFATGDLGQMDAAGWLVVRGRKDNLFISGGENIQPEEVEAALTALPDVLQAVVVPVADATFGQRPVAFVQPRSGRVDAVRLAEALAARLPRFKIPIVFLALPGDDAGGGLKPKRATLANLAERAVRSAGG